jgi:glucokinase
MSQALPTVLGVDLGGTNVRAGRVVQTVVDHAAMGLRDTGDSQSVIDDICTTISRVLTPDVKAIGIGVPSLVDPVQGVVYNVTNIPSWKEVHLKQILEAKFQLPVHVNNDANCFALGEYHYGQGRGSRYLVGLILGTGLGAGLIARGRLFLGANCGAGEIGNLPFRGDTLEHSISGPRFDRLHGIDGQTQLERAQAGDRSAQDAFADFGSDLGWAMKVILYAYDPDTILLGGSVSKAFPFFEGAMRRAMSDFAYPHVLPGLRILPTQDAHMPILGAAALCLDAAS